MLIFKDIFFTKGSSKGHRDLKKSVIKRGLKYKGTKEEIKKKGIQKAPNCAKLKILWM